MNLESLLLPLHIVFGSLGILLGPIIMLSKKQRGIHTRLGEIYHWNMLAICLTAIVLAILEWDRLGWFFYVALFSYSFAFMGYVSGKIRWKSWIFYHLAGQGGSYIAMTTALLVVNVGVTVWWAWVIPSIIGSPIISWVSRGVALSRGAKI
jgi:hypothetical protein